jgi:hypothetical protein
MTRRTPLLGTLIGGGLAVVALSLCGCNYSSPVTPVGAPPGSLPGAGAAGPGAASAPRDCDPIPESDRQAILDNVIKLIQTAALKPGGNNFAIATQNLNQYFCDAPSEKFALPAAVRGFLLEQMPAVLEPIPPAMLDVATLIRDLESRTFGMPDARHIEDCMLYHSVAARVAQEGDDLERVRRLFRWIIAQVELVPVGSLSSPALPQAQARPYDVLVRGMAAEDNRFWAERSWLFMVLCRQIGVDVGLLTFTPRDAKEPVLWLSTALIDGKLYLFDAQIGLEVPGPGGIGVATLDDALRDPAVLGRLDLPGQSAYDGSRDALRASTSKIGVVIDSSPHYSAPRMALLQENLAGRNRTTLYCDPAAERDRFLRALGPHAGAVKYWPLPLQVEFRLFNDGKFVDATAQSLFFFDPKLFPLVYARMKQLRGELPEAIQDYVTFRFAVNPVFVNKQARLPAEFQQALDAYATYFLGLCCLEQGRAKEADGFFEQTLKFLPEPRHDQPFYNMFRWGAQTNLGRLHEARANDALAIACYTQFMPTAQRHGNLVRARELLWDKPTGDLPPALPAAPVPPPLTPPLIAAPKAP